MRYSLVLIESDWNLKTPWEIEVLREAAVLIESDWNLKFVALDLLEAQQRLY